MLSLEGWMSLSNTMILDWLESRTVERERLIELLSGSLAGVVGTALARSVARTRSSCCAHLAPDCFASASTNPDVILLQHVGRST